MVEWTPPLHQNNLLIPCGVREKEGRGVVEFGGNRARRTPPTMSPPLTRASTLHPPSTTATSPQGREPVMSAMGEQETPPPPPRHSPRIAAWPRAGTFNQAAAPLCLHLMLRLASSAASSSFWRAPTCADANQLVKMV